VIVLVPEISVLSIVAIHDSRAANTSCEWGIENSLRTSTSVESHTRTVRAVPVGAYDVAAT
jgi:hypothetical protein